MRNASRNLGSILVGMDEASSVPSPTRVMAPPEAEMSPDTVVSVLSVRRRPLSGTFLELPPDCAAPGARTYDGFVQWGSVSDAANLLSLGRGALEVPGVPSVLSVTWRDVSWTLIWRSESWTSGGSLSRRRTREQVVDTGRQYG
jgi:hypothetical protein